jgi:hypothetical protein
MRTEGVWSYSTLYDVRGMSGNPSIAELRRILEVHRQPGADGRHAGPVAVVVTDPLLYVMACAYAAFSVPGGFGVFRDLQQAETWLRTTAQSPGVRPIPRSRN